MSVHVLSNKWTRKHLKLVTSAVLYLNIHCPVNIPKDLWVTQINKAYRVVDASFVCPKTGALVSIP